MEEEAGAVYLLPAQAGQKVWGVMAKIVEREKQTEEHLAVVVSLVSLEKVLAGMKAKARVWPVFAFALKEAESAQSEVLVKEEKKAWVAEVRKEKKVLLAKEAKEFLREEAGEDDQVFLKFQQ